MRPFELPETFERIPRLRFLSGPTPLQQAERLSQALSTNIFIKRDDLTGLATGGNKTRKLEFLVADALEKNADCIITAGGVQSNHCRQTAAAAAKHGMECHLVFGGVPPPRMRGNYFLDQLLGARFYWTEKQLRNIKMAEVAEKLRSSGRNPYMIPIGGSNSLGAMGYVAAMFELAEQTALQSLQFDHLIFATSSGGTQAGITLGACMTGFRGKITGISIDQLPDEKSEYKYKSFVLDITNGACKMLGIDHLFSLEDIAIDYSYLGKGYGVVGEPEKEAIKMLAQTEGILVGPVYTGRALSGLIDLIRQQKIRLHEKVLFWHTGDDVTLHAYVDDILGNKIEGD